jgi:hypothetical protein
MVSAVATIAYEAEVGPHAKRNVMQRRLRMQRLQALHEHYGRAIFWRIIIPSLLLFWALVAYGIYSAI